LIGIFIVRKNHLEWLQRFGWLYLLLAIPAAAAIFLAIYEKKALAYPVFLVIFLAFLAMEWVCDFVLKLDFRRGWKRNWKILVPYLAFYYAMNYGFVVMPWKESFVWGIVMLGLFVIQIVLNLRSHSEM
jgi:hypothetical protein